MSTESPSPPDQLRKPHDNDTWWLLRRVWDRLNRNNEHFMGVVVGREGSGKSYTALRIADEVDPTFNADRVIFDVTDLLKRLKDGDHEPGQFYVLDEAGVSFGIRTWHDRAQILANQALQLIRNHNLGLIFTLPRMGEFDSQAQGRLQAFMEINEKVPEKYIRGKWKWLDPDRTDSTGKIYRKYPRRRQNGQKKMVKSVAFRPPREAIVEPYEEEKEEFQEQHYERTIEELEAEEAENEESRKSPSDIAEEILNDEGLDTYVSVHGGNHTQYVDWKLIRAERGLSQNNAKTVKSYLEQELENSEVEAT